jgi:glycosyltransferase involved in cell wall biosynthesis
VIRVQLLIPTLDQSGAEKQLTLLATRLPRDEFDVEVVALTRSGPYEETLREADIPVTVIGKCCKFDPFSLRRLKQLIRERQPDVLHTWLFAANTYGRIAAGPRPQPKIVVSERCVDSWKARWQLWFDRRLISRTDRFIGNSQAVVDFYRNVGVPQDRLTVIRNGVETPADAARSRESVCDDLNVPQSARLVGFVGRLAPQKRLKDLIWAFHLLVSVQPDAYFVIVGDGPERAQLEKFAADIPTKGQVRFVGHRDDVDELMGHFDAFWLASDFEGQSNSLMEAMAAGVPVVASDIAPNLELVTHEETGLIVPVGDKATFAMAVDRLLKDSDFAATLAANAQRQMREEFSIDAMVNAHATLYRELAALSS